MFCVVLLCSVLSCSVLFCLTVLYWGHICYAMLRYAMLCYALHCTFIPMLIAGLLFLSHYLHAPSDTAVCVLLRHAVATPHVTSCMSSYAAANFPLINPPYFMVGDTLAVVQLAPSKSTCERFQFIHAILSHPIQSLTSLTSRVMRRRSIFQFLSQR